MIQFWFLWVFITLVVVIVLSSQKGKEEMPRKYPRAVKQVQVVWAGRRPSSGPSLGWILGSELRLLGMSRDAYYGMHRQMPMTC